jgi:hypothetical protein
MLPTFKVATLVGNGTSQARFLSSFSALFHFRKIPVAGSSGGDREPAPADPERRCRSAAIIWGGATSSRLTEPANETLGPRKIGDGQLFEVRDGRTWRAEINIEEPGRMTELQTSTRLSGYRWRNGAHLLALGDRVKRARLSTQARRREILHDAAIITVGFLICVVAICILFGQTLPSLADAAPMPDWPPGSI